MTAQKIAARTSGQPRRTYRFPFTTNAIAPFRRATNKATLANG